MSKTIKKINDFELSVIREPLIYIYFIIKFFNLKLSFIIITQGNTLFVIDDQLVILNQCR